MKAGRSFHCLFWALLYCVLYLVSANEDELMDFDFTDTKSGVADWNYLDDELSSQQTQAKQDQQKLESNMLDFTVEMEDADAQNKVPPFDWRERALRYALSKALTDRALRQKFVEVMPILRVLSSQQRLALSALISAQMNAKHGHELRLEQVRMMFGDDKKLLLPIVYDLANLVKNSARKYINMGSDFAAAALLRTPMQIQKRKHVLTVEEQAEEDDTIGTIAVDAAAKPGEDDSSLEDFFDEMQSEVLDPQLINEALQGNVSKNSTNTTTTPMASTRKTSSMSKSHGKRVRRAAKSSEFVHKLTRSVPLSANEEDLLRGAAGRTIQLNTTAFLQPSENTRQIMPTNASTASNNLESSASTSASQPSTQSYVEVEDLAFAGLNGTELELNANDRTDQAQEEPLPSPEELIAGPRYRFNKVHGMRPSQKVPIKRKRLQPSSRGRPKPAASSYSPAVTAAPRKCERFTSNMCIRTDDYPLDQIMGSIRRHKNAMSALLAEFYDKPNNNVEFGDEFDDYIGNKKRREDEGSVGGMCQSIVRYARPQKAKSASGEWKYIVNTGQHTQTLRLEKCSNPGESCSYLAQTYRSHCSQVYNYHRLLSWDKIRGLHVDIFKVPTCCSCQVDGYRQQFPPLSSLQAKDFTPSYNIDSNGYSTINEDDLDYNEESDEDDLGSYNPFNNVGGNTLAHRDTNELFLSSKKVRSKVPAPPTVGAYLSPPDDEEIFSGSSYKAHKSLPSSTSSSKKYYSHLNRRRPQHNEPRVDLDLAPSETHSDQEVNVFGPALANSEKPRVPLNRKRIYSATHTAAGAAGGARVGAGVGAQTTAATSYPLPAGGGASSAASAAHAHQTVVAPVTVATSNIAIGAGSGYIQRNYVGTVGSKSRPRFYAPATSATTAAAAAAAASGTIPISSTATSSLPTESGAFQRATHQQKQQQQQQHQSTALPQPPPIYHVNSIYGSSGHNGTKRINYNYHPIIDFFEKNRRSETTSRHSINDFSPEESRRIEQRIYPNGITSSAPTSKSIGNGMGMGAGTATYQSGNSHERRIGYGAGAGGGGGGASGAVGGAGLGGYANDNAWHPLVVES